MNSQSPNDLDGEVMILRPRPEIANIVLSHPPSRNALGWSMWTQLRDAVEKVGSDDEIRVVIFSGANGVFSSGGDMKSSPARGSGLIAPVARLELAHQVVSMVYELAKPTVAAVQGFAVGIGWSLVLACDISICANDAFFLAPFTDRDMVPDGGSAWLLVQRLGHNRASSLLMLGDRLSAIDAASAGIVNKLVESDEVEDEALSCASALARKSTDILRLTKSLMRAAPSLTLDEFLGRELLASALAASREDAEEGRRAFAEGRSGNTPPAMEETS
jgi:2-(1,2-epoxy-1,2-dihydrophenyl)acetyl-CoA isomerase